MNLVRKRNHFFILVFSIFFVSCNSQKGDEGYLASQVGYVRDILPEFGKVEHPFIKVKDEPLSTISADVDTASYSRARSSIENGSLPPLGEIRTEEFVNYFAYKETEPKQFEQSLAVSYEVGKAPWNEDHRLIKAIVKAKDMETEEVPSLNLVFLIDVSGSMEGERRLGLSVYALRFLVDILRPQDRISIVTYSDEIEVLLDGVQGSAKSSIESGISKLQAGGGTAGHKGIQTAYKVAQKNFLEGGINRVILSTDGDFNVGVSNTDELVQYVESWSHSNIFLTVHGYGMSHFNDRMLEEITNKGNGNYSFIDNRAEAKRVFQTQLTKTLSTVAKDAKIQFIFDEENVESYRLIGYENRRLDSVDFENDEVDAGDVGAGQVVVVFFEVILNDNNPDKDFFNVAELKLRFKEFPGTHPSKLYKTKILDENKDVPSLDYCFASAVAGFSLVLGNSSYIGDYNLEKVLKLAQSCGIQREQEERINFLKLIEKSLGIVSN